MPSAAGEGNTVEPRQESGAAFRVCGVASRVYGRLRAGVEGFSMKTINFVVLAAVLTLDLGSALAANRQIYPDPSQAKTDIAAALKAAAATHKRILLDFGGDWCGDCQVLDLYFHDAANRPILEANYVLVHVNIGHMDANLEIAERYGIPLHKGVPALAVLDEKGVLLYSQKTGEFEDMRNMESSSVTKFLLQWKPVKPGCSAMMVNC
jgi:thiol:disulfide interchange protein